ncbi:hypothetical protein GBF35_41220 [Nonomuraea phyllanthi]|nr:hypothetical protein GBF35_41220 [Nonomuraea phyllanthi]
MRAAPSHPTAEVRAPLSAPPPSFTLRAAGPPAARGRALSRETVMRCAGPAAVTPQRQGRRSLTGQPDGRRS